MKLIICAAGKPAYRGYRIRDFLYLPKYELYVWGGRELDIKEFNEVSRTVFDKNSDIRPFAQVVPDPVAAPAPAPEAKPAEQPPAAPEVKPASKKRAVAPEAS